jgi:FkbM family methyltransferase
VTSVVVDLGCHFHPDNPSDASVVTLLARFRPALFYGFDPHPDTAETCAFLDGGKVTIRRQAAWTFDGETGYYANGITSRLEDDGEPVACFDLAAWLTVSGPVTMKMDVEGAEYELLEHLIATGADRNVERLLVEWHEPPIGPKQWKRRQRRILAALDCPVEDWN